MSNEKKCRALNLTIVCNVIPENQAYGGTKGTSCNQTMRSQRRSWTFCHILASAENTFSGYLHKLKTIYIYEYKHMKKVLSRKTLFTPP